MIFSIAMRLESYTDFTLVEILVRFKTFLGMYPKIRIRILIIIAYISSLVLNINFYFVSSFL